MKLKPIIDRIKDRTTTLNSVAGASQYAAEVEAARLDPPCAFVVRGQVYTEGESASLGQMEDDRGVVTQTVYEEFGVAVCVDNGDKRGQQSEELLDDIREDLFHALLGWIPQLPPPDEYNAFDFVGETPLELNRARIWRLFIFRTSFGLSSLDH